MAAVDPDKLQRVLMNLLANAFKFVARRRPVRCALQQIDRTSSPIAVDDSGPGVKPEMRQAIFERFRQGDGGTNRKAGGTGLGLAIAKEFVEMHKGRIEVLGFGPWRRPVPGHAPAAARRRRRRAGPASPTPASTAPCSTA